MFHVPSHRTGRRPVSCGCVRDSARIKEEEEEEEVRSQNAGRSERFDSVAQHPGVHECEHPAGFAVSVLRVFRDQ